MNCNRMSDVKFLYITPHAAGNAPTATGYKWQAHVIWDMASALYFIIHAMPYV